MKKYIQGVLSIGLVAGTTACLDLNVVNENAPDIKRALEEPGDVENIIQSAFRIWYSNTLHGLADVAIPYQLLSDEGTSSIIDANGKMWAEEPRTELVNDPLNLQVWVPRRLWDNFSECTSNTNDGLRRIKEGLKIRTLTGGADTVTDNTDRAYVWAKFWQGTCLGYLALAIDKFPPATEDTVIPGGFEEQRKWEQTHIKPWQEGMAVAIRSLEQAIERATNGAQWSTPEPWMPGSQLTNQQVIEAAHTMIARLMVYGPRTPEERAQVNWDKVLEHTEKGLTYDFGPVLASGIITDASYLARITNTNYQYRADLNHIGPADQSGAWQAWQAKPPEDRAPFLIVTPDRRITGNAAGTANGAYYRYNSNVGTGFAAERGVYLQSNYQWFRRSNYGGFTSSSGKHAIMSVDENRLFRAEALLRKGDVAGAVALINVTRTRLVKVGGTASAPATTPNLPAITTAGVPEVAGQCVPRTKTGACGSVMDALMYERAIELVGQNSMRPWVDKRGFGQLQEGTLLHMPISARYLQTLEIPFYTFGGKGAEGSAKCYPATTPHC